jgi:phage-related minor tail protein
MIDNNGNETSVGPGGWITTVEKASETTATLKHHLDDADKAGQRFARTLTSAFEGVALKGKSLGDVFKGVALSLSQIVLRAAFAPLEKGVGSFVATALRGIGIGGGAGGATGFKSGGVVPFASGGVISNPMTFPLSGGRTGLAGEAGPEAIMPLRRGPDGRLGVAAAGGGAGPNITINISTPDAESFRRSETQVAAMIARAAQLGQRNL